jgi:ketosteroid isomerase-like protein
MMNLQSLAAERDIREGLGRFARVLDGKAWDVVAEVFADDVVFDYGAGGEQHGIEALRNTFRRYLDVCGHTQHLIGSIMITVEGDRALSHSYVQARHVGKAGKAGAVFDSNGEYHDRWERRPQGWRIVERRVDWLMHAGDPSVLDAGQDDLH